MKFSKVNEVGPKPSGEVRTKPEMDKITDIFQISLPGGVAAPVGLSFLVFARGLPDPSTGSPRGAPPCRPRGFEHNGVDFSPGASLKPFRAVCGGVVENVDAFLAGGFGYRQEEI